MPITIFVSEHVFLGFRAAVRFALHKIGSKETRRERSERYAERKKHLGDLEVKDEKERDFIVQRKRRKSLRLESVDMFWTKQVDDGASEQAGIELIRVMKMAEEARGGRPIKMD